MTNRVFDREGAAMNKAWRAEQARLHPKPAETPRIEATAADKPAVIPKQTPQKQPDQNRGPAECEGCQIKPECKEVLRLWHKHAPRPDLCRAWAVHIAKNRAAMPCLRDESADEHRLDLRREK